MCVIAICVERFLTEEEFKNCWRFNNDGVGIAWRKEEKDQGDSKAYVKGLMTLEEAEIAYNEIKENNILPHVIHFRKATAGGVSEDLTHPFIVSEESPVDELCWTGNEPLLFHNGAITKWQDSLVDFFLKIGRKIPDGAFSDTRLAAVMVHYLGDNLLRFLSGKFAIMVEDKTFMYGGFEKEKGVYFSNTDYKSKTGAIYGTYRSGNNSDNKNSKSIEHGRRSWWHEEEMELYGGAWGYSGTRANYRQNKMEKAEGNSGKGGAKESRNSLLNRRLK